MENNLHKAYETMPLDATTFSRMVYERTAFLSPTKILDTKYIPILESDAIVPVTSIELVTDLKVLYQGSTIIATYDTGNGLAIVLNASTKTIRKALNKFMEKYLPETVFHSYFRDSRDYVVNHDFPSRKIFTVEEEQALLKSNFAQFFTRYTTRMHD